MYSHLHMQVIMTAPVKALKTLSVVGAGDLYVSPGFAANALSATAAGSGNVVISSFAAQSATLQTSG